MNDRTTAALDAASSAMMELAASSLHGSDEELAAWSRKFIAFETEATRLRGELLRLGMFGKDRPQYRIAWAAYQRYMRNDPGPPPA